jgi:multiple antibiotic resistance protein
MNDIYPFLNSFMMTFVAVFVAVDAIGNIPIFISLVDGMSGKQRNKIITDSVITATAIALLFVVVGKLILSALNITIPDFQIAGGALLFFISMRLLLPAKGFLSDSHDRDVGVFPLGTPLITGPAVLTTVLMMVDSYGIWPTMLSLLVNMLIVWVSLVRADSFLKALGPGGLRAMAKIMYILLASIGVMMVRRGITSLLKL